MEKKTEFLVLSQNVESFSVVRRQNDAERLEKRRRRRRARVKRHLQRVVVRLAGRLRGPGFVSRISALHHELETIRNVAGERLEWMPGK